MGGRAAGGGTQVSWRGTTSWSMKQAGKLRNHLKASGLRRFVATFTRAIGGLFGNKERNAVSRPNWCRGVGGGWPRFDLLRYGRAAPAVFGNRRLQGLAEAALQPSDIERPKAGRLVVCIGDN